MKTTSMNEQTSMINGDYVVFRRPEENPVLKLRERIMHNDGFETFSELDVLTHFVGYVNGTENARIIALSLLDYFGNLKGGVLQARPEQLQGVKGCTGKMASLIASIYPIVRRVKLMEMEEPERCGNSTEAEKLALSMLQGERVEKFCVVAVNAQCRILGRRVISTGSISEVCAYPRLIMETALNYNAHSVLLTHNHPGGTCAPSSEDIASTLQIQRLLNGVGILVLDHIIVANDRTYSMIKHGDIDYRIRKP